MILSKLSHIEYFCIFCISSSSDDHLQIDCKLLNFWVTLYWNQAIMHLWRPYRTGTRLSHRWQQEGLAMSAMCYDVVFKCLAQAMWTQQVHKKYPSQSALSAVTCDIIHDVAIRTKSVRNGIGLQTFYLMQTW